MTMVQEYPDCTLNIGIQTAAYTVSRCRISAVSESVGNQSRISHEQTPGYI